MDNKKQNTKDYPRVQPRCANYPEASYDTHYLEGYDEPEDPTDCEAEMYAVFD